MECLILGGGMSGLAAGWASGLPVYEAERVPGGSCSSYYMRPHSQERLPHPPDDGEAYRFEVGGGHWVFGGDPSILRFIGALAPYQTFERVASVFLPDQGLYVPYPLQIHLGYLSEELRKRAMAEMHAAPKSSVRTMEEWLVQNFGATLTETFFGPFHELYTAGLWKTIAPQDAYKSPLSREEIRRGAANSTAPTGYNPTFVYPLDGLDRLVQRMAERCHLHGEKRATHIDARRKSVVFADGTTAPYDTLISTLPLNQMMDMTGLQVSEPPDPYTSVLVLNLGATRGGRCPGDHWIYLPRSAAGFHRVGFYSNVDASFLPGSERARRERVGLYVERAHKACSRPSPEETARYAQACVEELRAWGFIEKVEAIDPTWIEVAYTWSWPGSAWRAAALQILEDHDIQMVGRYGRWVFQGIADSLRDGFIAGAGARGLAGDAL